MNILAHFLRVFFLPMCILTPLQHSGNAPLELDTLLPNSFLTNLDSSSPQFSPQERIFRIPKFSLTELKHIPFSEAHDAVVYMIEKAEKSRLIQSSEQSLHLTFALTLLHLTLIQSWGVRSRADCPDIMAVGATDAQRSLENSVSLQWKTLPFF